MRSSKITRKILLGTWRLRAVRVQRPGQLWLLFLVSSVSAMSFVIFLMLLRQAPPYAMMQLRSTYLEQFVEREALTSFELPAGPWMNSDGDPCLKSISERASDPNVLIQPRAGVRLQYRWRPGRLAIILNSDAAELPVAEIAQDGMNCLVSDRLVIRLDVSATDSLMVLPIAGPAAVGAENVGMDHFLGGEVHLSARALLPPTKGALYPASDTPIILAEGGRLAAAQDIREGQSWYGTARVTPDGLVIAANTETASLVLIRAGDSGEIEPLRVGLLAKLFQDPSVAPWSVGTLFVLTVLQLVISAMALSPSTGVAPSINKSLSRDGSNDLTQASASSNPKPDVPNASAHKLPETNT